MAFGLRKRGQRKPRRFGRLGLVLAVGLLIFMVAMPYYRAWQLRSSCENGGGLWNAELDQCIFYGRNDGPSNITPSVPEPPRP